MVNNDKKVMQWSMLVAYCTVTYGLTSHSRIDMVFCVPFGAIAQIFIFRKALEDTESNISCFTNAEDYINGMT